MAEPFAFEFVSPEQLVLSGEATEVQVPGTDGEFTVMANHAPVMSTIKPGVVEVKLASGESSKYFVRGGFADVAPTGFTILADYAVPEGDLTTAILDQDIEAAEHALADAPDGEPKRLAMEQRDHLREFKATLAK